MKPRKVNGSRQARRPPADDQAIEIRFVHNAGKAFGAGVGSLSSTAGECIYIR
jgi:hypothetical protein